MVEYFYSIDVAIFKFCNQTLATPVSDTLMPLLTDWNRSPVCLVFTAILWLLLFWRGGRKGKLVALMLIPLIAFSDQISSDLIKTFFARPRPCHLLDGIPAVDHIRLLVPCGPGFSFPSSHAVNNFAFAAFVSHYYRKWAVILYLYAGLMGFSRISVGVHYPSDVIGGAAVGFFCALVFIIIHRLILKYVPLFSPKEDEPAEI